MESSNKLTKGANAVSQGANAVSRAIALFHSLERDENLRKKWMKQILKDYKKTEIIEIAKSGGSNIGKAFRDKKTKEWRKYRKFNVPVGWCLGVWTGGTMYSLIKGAANKPVTTIIEKVGADSIVYGYKGTKYINFELGVTEDFKVKSESYLKKQVEEFFSKNL